MRITIHQKSTVIPNDLRERIDKKISKLDKYFYEDVEVVVKASEEKGARNIIEITINMDGTVLRAEEISNDMYLSADRAIDKIVKQIKKHRARFETRLRSGAFDQAGPDYAGEAEEAEADTEKLVKIKRFELKPMPVEDAISQMDMLGHSFFLFINAETGGTCVVYRRLDGDVGMLEPTNA